MRKYRNKEVSLDISNFKFAANRIWTGRMAVEEPDEDACDSEAITGETVAALRDEIRKLRDENERMRFLLFHRQNEKTGIASVAANSCPPKLNHWYQDVQP